MGFITITIGALGVILGVVGSAITVAGFIIGVVVIIMSFSDTNHH